MSTPSQPMSSRLIEIIKAAEASQRDQSLESACASMSLETLMREGDALDRFRRQSDNLYERVRALFFLYAIHRFQLPSKQDPQARGKVPFEGVEHLLNRRFDEAIEVFLHAQGAAGPNPAISSALAAAYQGLGIQTLANQVRRSVRSVRGNQWMFRMGHPLDQPLRARAELLDRPDASAPFPILRERTPVRMDLSHSGWSDIFFLGMDFPEGAKVLNISVDLGVHGRDAGPQPPVEAYWRVIDEPVLRLTSVDLGATADITQLAEVFDFAKDYLGLLKAAVIAAGIVPPGIEGSGQNLADLLARIVGRGRGLEIASSVNGIPKGSRLAVSTNLLACLISVCMRATGQTESFTGCLRESERRLVAARAILGEWLGGSGGGWQDSGGVWPGIKLITGEVAAEADPEYGISRGRLLPRHQLLGEAEVPPAARAKLQDSLVLAHGGMAQNVGPILEMVTEKYLLRSEKEWQGRRQAIGLMNDILDALRTGNVRGIGAATTRNFEGPIQTIIPWASNFYTETVLRRVRREFGADFWGFWMLGGMSGGGMGYMFAPEKKAAAQDRLLQIMAGAKRELESALPFAMNPVVYDFSINEQGTFADLLPAGEGLLPMGYYALIAPPLLRSEPRLLNALRRAELDRFGAACRTRPELGGMVQTLFDRLLPRLKKDRDDERNLSAMLTELGFDRVLHEQIRKEMRAGRIGLAQNRLPATTPIEDVTGKEVVDATAGVTESDRRAGERALADGRVAVIVLAAGSGSRWTQGAGVVKALHPFCKLAGRHRSFIETHLAKGRRAGRLAGASIPFIITTSHLTHGAIQAALERQANWGYPGPVLLSPGRAIGLRLIPMVRDLRFAWEEMPQQRLDEQAQKVRDSLRAALLDWATRAGEGDDYTDNTPTQCLHPAGHWFEIPNLLRNGVLAGLLAERPQLQYLLLHNIDTVGAHVDAGLLGMHINSEACLSFEVIARQIEDRGGGLARVNGRARMIEGLAMPREQDEFKLTYYNSATTWIHLDRLLSAFGLRRKDLADAAKVADAIRAMSARMPTYVTLKDVKKRWGHGQEDVFPVAQFEKLWSDMSALPECDCQYVVVPRRRGQQLKEQAQLDGWLRDGTAAYVESLGDWELNP
jgi:hypothetical protein